jgi:hypothetical protein
VSVRLLVLAVLLAIAGEARAEGLYLSEPQLAERLFPEAKTLVASTLVLSDAEAERVGVLFGYRLEQKSFRLLAAGDAGTIFVLDLMGQNAPITFGVGITPDGVVRGVELVAYRESRGEEIRAPRFLRQLTGKRLADPLKLGKDVDAITGATISSRSATLATRKALALAQVLRERAAAAAPPR